MTPAIHDIRDQQRGPARAAFSLIEFTAVLALMALLAGIVALNVKHFTIKGKQNAVRVEIATLRNAIEAYYNANGTYPSSDEGLAALTRRTEKNPEPLIREMPIDPWGRPYQYVQPGRDGPYEIVCFGADGREGGTGADTDIGSWNLKENPGSK